MLPHLTVSEPRRAMYPIHEALAHYGWTSLALIGRKAASDKRVFTHRLPTRHALALASRFVDLLRVWSLPVLVKTSE
jgi:hypothetical protein